MFSEGRTRIDVLDVPGEHPVNERIQQHHEDGDDEGVAVVLLRTDPDVAPLNADALLFITGEILTAVSERHTRQQALSGRRQRGQTHA